MWFFKIFNLSEINEAFIWQYILLGEVRGDKTMLAY